VISAPNDCSSGSGCRPHDPGNKVGVNPFIAGLPCTQFMVLRMAIFTLASWEQTNPHLL
jgi:hypothetical protein